MPYQNLSIGIDDNLRQTLLNFLSNMELNMSFLVQLTPSEKKNYLRLGTKSPAFLKRTVELSKQNQQILPNYVNQSEFEKDVQDFEFMSHQRIKQHYAQKREIPKMKVAVVWEHTVCNDSVSNNIYDPQRL
jgi:hypothetical protein